MVLRLLCGMIIGGRQGHEAELILLAPEMLPELAKKLAPGARLTIQEGHRDVADCDVISVRQEEINPIRGKLSAHS